ncbi:hypothetical protein SeMB42_g00573 [Synchytrium endobioticum]|uniref:RRM domain-containing protein n=1 Tax=Synchytrium endobioticum TaxID=286115 RepID=A0A507DR38_9FUNG|nr:hypothetical protein SeMB42_g00573 [Synchytrium endobioticum]
MFHLSSWLIPIVCSPRNGDADIDLASYIAETDAMKGTFTKIDPHADSVNRKALIHITQISPQAPEKTIRDFFVFCGKISNLDLKQSDDRQDQECLILFEKESAARSDHASHRHFPTVNRRELAEPLMSTSQHTLQDSNHVDKCNDSRSAHQSRTIFRRGRPRTSANFYQVLQALLKFDQKYGFTRVAMRVAAPAVYVDRKLGVSDKVINTAIELAEYFMVEQRLTDLKDAAVLYTNAALTTSVGQQVEPYFELAKRVGVESFSLLQRRLAKQQNVHHT